MHGKNNKALLATTAAAGFLLASSALGQTEIPVTFQADGCPVAGSVPDITTSRGRTLIWQAKDQAGQNTDVTFKIYFDPIQGATLRAQNGRVSRPIDGNAPLVDYKYTIVSERCEAQPEDPLIRVSN